MTRIDVSKHSKICILFKHRKLGKCQQETAERVKVKSPSREEEKVDKGTDTVFCCWHKPFSTI